MEKEYGFGWIGGCYTEKDKYKMKHFSISELVRSDTAKSKGIDNTPSEEVIKNLTTLVEKILDPLREKWGKPLVVSSGYRSPALNKAVGGSSSSSHMSGCAADIHASESSMERRKAKNRELFLLIQKSGLPFTQLIDEKNYQWIHISYDMSRTKQGQILHL